MNLEISKVTGFFHLFRVFEMRITLENEEPHIPYASQGIILLH